MKSKARVKPQVIIEVKSKPDVKKHKGCFAKIVSVILLMFVGLTAIAILTEKNSSIESNGVDVTNQPSATPVATETDDTPHFYMAEEFVSKFNSISDIQIEGIEEFDPQDILSYYYRTEYRLSAYDESLGIHGDVGNVSLDVVEYGIDRLFSDRSLRVYLYGTEEEVLDIYDNVVHAIAPEISQEDIQLVKEEYRNAYAGDLRGGLMYAESNETVQSDYITLHVSNHGQSRMLNVFIDISIK